MFITLIVFTSYVVNKFREIFFPGSPSLFIKIDNIKYYSPEFIESLSMPTTLELDYLLRFHQPEYTTDFFGDTPLHVSARCRDSLYTRHIITYSGYHKSIDQENIFGLTPLQCAVMSGNVRSIEVLIDLGALIILPEPFHNALLHCSGARERNVSRNTVIFGMYRRHYRRQYIKWAQSMNKCLIQEHYKNLFTRNVLYH